MLKEEYIISFGQEVPADTACSRNKDRFDMAKTWVIWEQEVAEARIKEKNQFGQMTKNFDVMPSSDVLCILFQIACEGEIQID